MTDTKNAAGAPPPTASHELLNSHAIVPPAATGDQGPRDLSLVASTAYSDPDDTTATVLFGVDYTPDQLDEIAEHTRCAVLSTPATAEEVAAGAVPKLGLTLADFDDIRVIGMDSPRLTENAADRIAAVITDQAGGRLTRPEVRETITTAHLHRGTDVHLTVSNGRPVKDINDQHVLGPERSTTAVATPGDHRTHRERAFAEAKAEKLADLRVRRMSRENPPPRLEPLVEDLLDRYTTGFIAGLPGEGKTWTDVELACAVATGRPFAGGHATHQGPVVILAGEGEQVTLDRIRAWERANLD